MGIKREVKEEITRKLEENFEFILNTKDSILNMQNTLSTDELTISMYHIKIFMKNKGYVHNKITNEWNLLNGGEEISSNNEETKEEDIVLKTTEDESVGNKESLNETLTEDLRECLKKNSKERKKNNTKEQSSNFEEKSEENIAENISENIKEKSLIPEESIIKDIWKNTDNTASNCELILKSISLLSSQVNEASLLSAVKKYNTDSEINDENSVKISSSQLMDILDGEKKRYEITLEVALFEAIVQKYCLKHPDRTYITQLKDSRIIYKILVDYFISQ